MVYGGDKEKKALFELYHDTPTARHAGVAKTLQALGQDYWWLDIACFISAYVRECAQC